MRPLTRLRLVLPSQRAPDLRAHPTAEVLAARLADALAVHGVQVRQQLLGAPPDGAPRADVSLWLPDVDGAAPALDVRLAPARAHAALVVDPALAPRHLARYDAVLVPHPGLREQARASLKRASAREVPVVVARLVGAASMAREAEKALHGVAGRRAVLIDARDGFEGEIERVVVQLGLKSQEAAAVLLVPHEERARLRVRTLCGRHGVDAWLASGPDAFCQSIAAVDLFVGRPRWHELLVAALHHVAVAWLPAAGPHALLDALHGQRRVEEVMGTLQLAAYLDRRLSDAGGLEARGIALRESLFGEERELIEALAAVEPAPQGAAVVGTWEAVGPHAAVAGTGAAAAVEAREVAGSAEPTRAQRIEDALQALKHKLGRNDIPGGGGAT